MNNDTLTPEWNVRKMTCGTETLGDPTGDYPGQSHRWTISGQPIVYRWPPPRLHRTTRGGAIYENLETVRTPENTINFLHSHNTNGSTRDDIPCYFSPHILICKKNYSFSRVVFIIFSVQFCQLFSFKIKSSFSSSRSGFESRGTI